VCLLHFLDEGDAGMRKVLHFCTARDSIPPLGLDEKVRLDYKFSLVFFAETCLLALQVPKLHNTFEEFYQQFLIAVNLGNKGFGSA